MPWGLAIGILIVVVVILLIDKYGRSRGPAFAVDDLDIRASRDTVLVGQKTDIRFLFTLKNPRRETLQYDATLEVEGFPAVNQSNSFRQDALRTAVPRLSASWTTTGVKKVTGTVKVNHPRFTLGGVEGTVEGFVNVVAELEDH